MAIYQLNQDRLEPLPQTSFAIEGIRERYDLQRLLREQIDIVSPDTLVIAEEFGEWEESRRRIDLLGVDRDANLVVIELKRTQDGGHMELQAVRYAAMISTLTFERVVDIFGRYLTSTGKELDPESTLLEFLDWDEPLEDEFAQDVKIVLASAEFSRELTTTVIWLNANGLDIKCIRLRPYKDADKVYLDVQQVIPLPEAEEYQVSIRDKSRKEKESRKRGRDLTKYTVRLGDRVHENLPKGRAIFEIIRYLCESGVHPEQIRAVITWKKNRLFRWFDGRLDSESFEQALAEWQESRGRKPQPWRYFVGEDELIYVNDKTYAFDRMWGNRTAEAMDLIVREFGDKGISYQESVSV